MGEIKVALVMGRAAENRPGAISHQDEVRDEDREFPVRDEGVRDAKAGVVAALVCGLDRLLAGAQLPAFLDECGGLRLLAGKVFGERVISSDGAKTGPENRVGSCRVDAQGIRRSSVKAKLI